MWGTNHAAAAIFWVSPRGPAPSARSPYANQGCCVNHKYVWWEQNHLHFRCQIGKPTRRGPAYSARKTVDQPICNPRSWIGKVWFYWRPSKLFKCLEIEECPSFDAKALEGVGILQWLPARFKPQLLSESFRFQIRATFFTCNEHRGE